MTAPLLISLGGLGADESAEQPGRSSSWRRPAPGSLTWWAAMSIGRF